MGNITIPETLYDGTLFAKKLMYNLNFVNDKIWVGADAPVLPIPGQLWWDSDASTFSVWTGAVWYQIYPASIGGTLVKISGNDTTANYLIAKLVAGTGVVLTELNDGGDEDLEVKIGQAVATTDSPVFAGLTINGNIIVTGTVDGLDLQSHNHSGANQGGTVNHVDLVNIGSNSHAQIDTHIADGTIHFLESTINHLNIQNIGSNSHAQIDTHIASTLNPHSVTYAQVGAIQDTTDVIKDTHIDWGLGANQISAVDIPIEDTGGYFTSTDVEGALQELGAAGGHWTRDSGNGYLYPTTLTDKVGVGVNVPEQMLDVKGKFQVWDEGPNNVGHIYIKSNYQSNGCGGISMWRSRGTKASPGNLLPDDYVGVIAFKPYYLDSWLNSADILVQVLSPVYSGSPSRMRFRTVRDGDIIPDEKFRIDPNNVIFNYDKKNYDFEIKGDNNDYVFYVDASVDQVGIGTNTPNEILTVEGVLSLDELSSPPSLTSGYGKIYVLALDGGLKFMNSSGTIYDLLSGGYWSRDAGNGYVYPTTLTDRVGIGTNTPDKPLHVADGEMRINNDASNTGIIDFGLADTLLGYESSIFKLRVYDGVDYFETLRLDGTNHYIYLAKLEGKVGIGIFGTNTPSAPLHIIGSSGSEALRIGYYDANFTGVWGKLYQMGNGGGFTIESYGSGGDDNSYKLQFKTNASNRLVIDKNGIANMESGKFRVQNEDLVDSFWCAPGAHTSTPEWTSTVKHYQWDINVGAGRTNWKPIASIPNVEFGSLNLQTTSLGWGGWTANYNSGTGMIEVHMRFAGWPGPIGTPRGGVEVKICAV